MHDLLFLAHRIPFPPNKGDKVRSYHLLRYLAERYRVHLAAFIDDTKDWEYVSAVSDLCAEAFFLELHPSRARWRSLTGLLRGEPLTLPYYRQRRMRAWVDERLGSLAMERVLVFSSGMAQYVTKHLRLGIRSVLDFVDVDSHKWGQYAARKPWPWNRVYRRESRVLGDFERTVATLFGASVFVSSSEAALFRARTGLPASRITHINNGVDADYFSAERNYPNPYSPGEKILVFTGAMDYWPNVDAVCWFAGEIFPEILQREPGARFYIVGARPTPAVRDLSRDPGVCVTGTVEDIRPYLAHARAAVAPLRIAQGVQNKVLEGMAMAKPVLATTLAMEGIEPCPGLTDRVADTPQAMQEEALLLLQGETNLQRGALGRQWVLQRYDWSRNLEGLVRLLEEQAVTM